MFAKIAAKLLKHVVCFGEDFMEYLYLTKDWMNPIFRKILTFIFIFWYVPLENRLK